MIKMMNLLLVASNDDQNDEPVTGSLGNDDQNDEPVTGYW